PGARRPGGARRRAVPRGDARRGKIVTVPDDPTTADASAVVSWRAVRRGALVGLAGLVAASVVEAILDRNIDSFRDSGWIYPLFVPTPLGYALVRWPARSQDD